MKRHRILAFWGAMVLALACIPVGRATTNTPASITYESYKVVSSGLQTGFTNPQFRVVTQNEEYAALLSEIAITGDAPTPDFRSDFMLAIFPGPIYGCRYNASVGSIVGTGKTLVVNVLLHFPPPDIGCTTVMDYNSPYLFVELQHTIKPISVLYHVVNW